MFIEFTPRYVEINTTYAWKINTLFRVMVDPTTGRRAEGDSYRLILINKPEKREFSRKWVILFSINRSIRNMHWIISNLTVIFKKWFAVSTP